MSQKRRKNAVIVSFLLPKVTLDAIDQRVNELALRSSKAALSRSGWIKRAIQRDLHHDVRSRSKRAKTSIPVVAGRQEADDRGLDATAASGIDNPAHSDLARSQGHVHTTMLGGTVIITHPTVPGAVIVTIE